MNTQLDNVVMRALKTTITAGIISKAINRIINAVRYNENPEAPEWKDDEMGTLVSHVLSRDRLGGLTCLKDI